MKPNRVRSNTTHQKPKNNTHLSRLLHIHKVTEISALSSRTSLRRLLTNSSITQDINYITESARTTHNLDTPPQTSHSGEKLNNYYIPRESPTLK
eukprot:c29731_g1_i1 orf=239-523(+)